MDNNKVRDAVESVRRGQRQGDSSTAFVRGDTVGGEVRQDEPQPQQPVTAADNDPED